MAQVRTVFENNHFLAQRLVLEPIVIVVRSTVPFASPGDATRGCVPMLLALDALGREDFWLLFDSRAAIGNNAPEYEASFARFRKDLLQGFPQAAFLLKSHAGTLQARRLLSADQAEERTGIFSDPRAALAFLRAGIRRATRRSSAPPPSGSASLLPRSLPFA